jgi:predicted transcriptional regulator
MTIIDQLQQLGLNKYEAEAYYTLLSEGPLTGYELGKRSQVPLSRSYEILERLTHKGLALVQPGDPPRYLAEEPEQFLGQVRQSVTKTLDALSAALADLSHPEIANEFWVLRGRSQIFTTLRAMIAGAQQRICLFLPTKYDAEVAGVLASAQRQGCSLIRRFPASEIGEDEHIILLLVDDRKALAGMLIPAEHCQAVVSENGGLIAPLRSYFAQTIPIETPIPVISNRTEVTRQDDSLNWVAWEDRKQRRLWNPNRDNRVA